MRLGSVALALALSGCGSAESFVDSKGSGSSVDASDVADGGSTPGDTGGGAAADARDADLDSGVDAGAGAADDAPDVPDLPDLPDQIEAPDADPTDAAITDATADAATDAGTDAASPDTSADAEVAPAPNIASFLSLLDAADSPGLGAFLDAWDGPVCEGGQCLFVTVQPGAGSVVVLGDLNGWQGGEPLTEVSFAPGVFWALVDMTVGAVSEYKLQVDGAWAVDGSNRYFRFGPFGPNSAIYGEGHSRLAWVGGVASAELGNERDLYVYLPAAYFEQPTAHFPVIYMQDGFNVFTNPAAPFGSWNVDATADALIGQGLAAPVILVGIDTSARLDEYTYAEIPVGGSSTTPKLPQYGAFLTGTVKPLVDATFRTLPDRPSTGIAGSSLGGISSLWLAWMHPDTFGLVASFSGSYWIGESEGTDGATPMRELLQSAAGPLPSTLRVYIDSGDSSFEEKASYEADAWVYSDWTRNTLVGLGWDNREAWDTDSDPGTPPTDLPASTAPASVPSLAWAPAPPSGSTWAGWLGTDRNLLSLVGHGHAHNEAAWEARFTAALVFLVPGPQALP